jgi:hypothetical protein
MVDAQIKVALMRRTRRPFGVASLAVLLALGLVAPATASQIEADGEHDDAVTCQGTDSGFDVEDDGDIVGRIVFDEPSDGKVTFEANEGFEGATVTLCIAGGSDVLDGVVLEAGESSSTAVQAGQSDNAAAVSNVKLLDVEVARDEQPEEPKEPVDDGAFEGEGVQGTFICVAPEDGTYELYVSAEAGFVTQELHEGDYVWRFINPNHDDVTFTAGIDGDGYFGSQQLAGGDVVFLTSQHTIAGLSTLTEGTVLRGSASTNDKACELTERDEGDNGDNGSDETVTPPAESTASLSVDAREVCVADELTAAIDVTFSDIEVVTMATVTLLDPKLAPSDEPVATLDVDLTKDTTVTIPWPTTTEGALYGELIATVTAEDVEDITATPLVLDVIADECSLVLDTPPLEQPDDTDPVDTGTDVDTDVETDTDVATDVADEATDDDVSVLDGAPVERDEVTASNDEQVSVLGEVTEVQAGARASDSLPRTGVSALLLGLIGLFGMASGGALLRRRS